MHTSARRLAKTLVLVSRAEEPTLPLSWCLRELMTSSSVHHTEYLSARLGLGALTNRDFMGVTVLGALLIQRRVAIYPSKHKWYSWSSYYPSTARAQNLQGWLFQMQNSKMWSHSSIFFLVLVPSACQGLVPFFQEVSNRCPLLNTLIKYQEAISLQSHMQEIPGFVKTWLETRNKSSTCSEVFRAPPLRQS